MPPCGFGAAGGDWRAVYTSPLSRCRAMAEAVAERLLIPLSVENDLLEIDHGKWDGRLEAAVPLAMVDLQQVVLDGERNQQTLRDRLRHRATARQRTRVDGAPVAAGRAEAAWGHFFSLAQGRPPAPTQYPALALS